MRTKILAIILVTLSVCAAAAASEGQAAETEQGIFSGTLADALWTMLAFILLLAILGKVAWKPLLNGLKDRQEHIKQQIEAAESARSQAEKMLDDCKHQGLQIIRQMTEQAQQQGQDLTEKTRQEVLAIKRRAQEDIEHARIAASEQLWEQAADIVQALSSEVLGRTITTDDNQRLTQEAIAKLRQ